MTDGFFDLKAVQKVGIPGVGPTGGLRIDMPGDPTLQADEKGL